MTEKVMEIHGFPLWLWCVYIKKKENSRDVHIKRLVGGLLLTLTCK